MEGTFGLAQHPYIIGTNSKGEQTILRAGPENNNMVSGDLKVVYVSYVKQNEKLFPNDWHPENKVEIYSISCTDTELQAKMDTMWKIGQQINSGNYDYKVPLPTPGKHIPDVIWHVQNSNTAGNLIAKSIGVDLGPILREKKLWAPGIDGRLDHTIMDRINKAALDNYPKAAINFDGHAGGSFYDLHKDKSKEFGSIPDHVNLEYLMTSVGLDWNILFDAYQRQDTANQQNLDLLRNNPGNWWREQSTKNNNNGPTFNFKNPFERGQGSSGNNPPPSPPKNTPPSSGGSNSEWSWNGFGGFG